MGYRPYHQRCWRLLEKHAQLEKNSSHGGNPAAAGSAVTFVGELWEDVKSSVEQKKDQKCCIIFFTSKDLSGRITPGTLAKVSDENFGVHGISLHRDCCLLTQQIAAALRSFSPDKDTIDHFNTIVKPAVYLSMFYFFNNPRSTILDNLHCPDLSHILRHRNSLCTCHLFDPGQAQLWSVLVPVVLTLVANQEGDKFVMRLGDFCYTSGLLESFLIANAKRYYGVWLITRCGSLKQRGYRLEDWYPCLGYLIIAGILSRGLAFFCLITFQKK
nr:ABC transporter G family member 28-like [Ipomoea batatas]